jgi:hypothetical protein
MRKPGGEFTERDQLFIVKKARREVASTIQHDMD